MQEDFTCLKQAEERCRLRDGSKNLFPPPYARTGEFFMSKSQLLG